MLSDLQLEKRIGGKLKAIRLKRNITQQSLAEASSISLSSLKKIENGEIGTFDCKKQVFDQQFSEKLISADFGKLVLHIVIDKAVMRQRAAASPLGA